MLKTQTSLLEDQLQKAINDLERARKEYNSFKEEVYKREMTLQNCQKQLSEVKAEFEKISNNRFAELKKENTAQNRLWKRKKDTVATQKRCSHSPSYFASCQPSDYLENERNHNYPLLSLYVLVVTFVCCVLFSGWIKGYM